MKVEPTRMILLFIIIYGTVTNINCQWRGLPGMMGDGGRQLTLTQKTCTDAEGYTGVCMFRFDCLRENGIPLTTCKENFLFGVCCKVDRTTIDNTVSSTSQSELIVNASRPVLDWTPAIRSPELEEAKDDNTTPMTTDEETEYSDDDQTETTTPLQSDIWTSEYGETVDPEPEYEEPSAQVPFKPIPLTNTWTNFPPTRPDSNVNTNSQSTSQSWVTDSKNPTRPQLYPTKRPNSHSTILPSSPATGSITQDDPHTIYQQIVTNPLFSNIYATASNTAVTSSTVANTKPVNQPQKVTTPIAYDGPQLLFNSWSPSHHKRIPGIPRPSSVYNANIQEKTPYGSYNHRPVNRPNYPTSINNHGAKRPSPSATSTTTTGQASIVELTNYLLQNATLEDLESFQNEIFKPSTKAQTTTTTTSTTQAPLRVYYETLGGYNTGTYYGSAVTYGDYGSTTNQIVTNTGYPQHDFTRPYNWQTATTFATTTPSPSTIPVKKDNSSLTLDGTNSALDTLIALLHPGSQINVSTAAPPLSGGIGSWENVFPADTTQQQSWTGTSHVTSPPSSVPTTKPITYATTTPTPARPPKDPYGSTVPIYTGDWTSTYQSSNRPWVTETPTMTMATPTVTKVDPTTSTVTKVSPTTSPVTTTTTTKPTTTTYTPRPIWDYRKTCGVRPLRPTGRVVGGRNTFFGEWPWQVLVKEATWLGLFVKNKCGGVLINTKYVITAAHCQPGFLASLLVILGEYDLTGDYESLKPLTKNVRRMIVHRDYNAQTFENDIALLEMDSPVTLKPHIVPICLPKPSEDFAGKRAYVSGWGKLTHGGPLPNVLQSVRVPVASNSDCQRMFLSAGHVKAIRDTFICAGYVQGGRDSCEGDSGGPLMIQRKDLRWVLIGTVSHGIGCADPNLPGVYMRTTSYLKWINSIIS